MQPPTQSICHSTYLHQHTIWHCIYNFIPFIIISTFPCLLCHTDNNVTFASLRFKCPVSELFVPQITEENIEGNSKLHITGHQWPMVRVGMGESELWWEWAMATQAASGTMRSRAHINIKMLSYHYMSSHYKDKTVFRSSYLYDRNPYTGKAPNRYHYEHETWQHIMSLKELFG